MNNLKHEEYIKTLFVIDFFIVIITIVIYTYENGHSRRSFLLIKPSWLHVSVRVIIYCTVNNFMTSRCFDLLFNIASTQLIIIEFESKHSLLNGTTGNYNNVAPCNYYIQIYNMSQKRYICKYANGIIHCHSFIICICISINENFMEGMILVV